MNVVSSNLTTRSWLIMDPRFAEVAILKVILDRLVKLGLISEQDRYNIYVEASTGANAAVLSDPKIAIDLLMLADSTFGDDDDDIDDDETDSEK